MGVDAARKYAEICRSQPRIGLQGGQANFNRKRDKSMVDGSVKLLLDYEGKSPVAEKQQGIKMVNLS